MGGQDKPDSDDFGSFGSVVKTLSLGPRHPIRQDVASIEPIVLPPEFSAASPVAESPPKPKSRKRQQRASPPPPAVVDNTGVSVSAGNRRTSDLYKLPKVTDAVKQRYEARPHRHEYGPGNACPYCLRTFRSAASRNTHVSSDSVECQKVYAQRLLVSRDREIDGLKQRLAEADEQQTQLRARTAELRTRVAEAEARTAPPPQPQLTPTAPPAEAEAEPESRTDEELQTADQQFSLAWQLFSAGPTFVLACKGPIRV